MTFPELQLIPNTAIKPNIPMTFTETSTNKTKYRNKTKHTNDIHEPQLIPNTAMKQIPQ